MRGVGAEP